MIFCLGDEKYKSKGEGYQKNNRIFNQEVSEDEFNRARDSRPSFELPMAKWVEFKDMTDQEKKDNSNAKTLDGYLRRLSWGNAWKEGWANASQEFKGWVKNLPHFNSGLFEKITGINIEILDFNLTALRG